MAQITVTVNGQRYSLACRDGEEARLTQLCARVDDTVSDLSVRVGQIGEARLLLMACLMLADELDEVRAGPQASPTGDSGDPAVDQLISRMESIVDGLENA